MSGSWLAGTTKASYHAIIPLKIWIQPKSEHDFSLDAIPRHLFIRRRNEITPRTEKLYPIQARTADGISMRSEKRWKKSSWVLGSALCPSRGGLNATVWLIVESFVFFLQRGLAVRPFPFCCQKSIEESAKKVGKNYNKSREMNARTVCVHRSFYFW